MLAPTVVLRTIRNPNLHKLFTKPQFSNRQSCLLSSVSGNPQIKLPQFEQNPNPNSLQRDSAPSNSLSLETVETALNRSVIEPDPLVLQRIFQLAQNKLPLSSIGIVFDSMVDILGKFQEFDSAWSLLREQLDTDETPLIVSTHTFGVLIRGYSRAGMYIPAIEVFEFARNLDPVSVNISSLDLFEILMDALCKEGKVGIATKYCDKRRELESGWIPSGRVYDVLISGRFCSGKLVQVEKLWEEMRRENVVPNVVTYAILVKGYCRMGQVDRGIELVEEMKREGIKPNVIVYNPIVDALSEAGRFDEAFGMVERLLVSDSGPSISTYKSLVKGFCKAGDFVGASKALKMMIGRGFVPTPTTYNYFFRYFSKIGKVEEGINLYKKMIEFGHAPNRLTYTLLIKMLCDLEKMNLAVQISKEMKDRGYDMDLTTGNMLLHLLCKLHRFEEACVVFEDMISRGIVPQYITYTKLTEDLENSGISKISKMSKMSEKLSHMIASVPHLSNSYRREEGDSRKLRPSLMQKARAMVDTMSITTDSRDFTKMKR